MVKQQVVLINKNNRKIGVEEKIKAHKEGKLHRAFSILKENYLYNSVLKENIIRADYGLILFAVIQNQMKPMIKQFTED